MSVNLVATEEITSLVKSLPLAKRQTQVDS